MLRQTQDQLQQLASSLDVMQVRYDDQARKLDDMDRRINKNFSVMFDSLCKKMDEARFVQ